MIEILGKEVLHDSGFDIPVGKVTVWQVITLNRVEEELPSASDIAKADDIELQEIAKSMENLIAQFKEMPMRELLGLDKQLRSIRGSLKVEVGTKVQLEENIKKEKCKLEEFRDHPGVYDDGIQEEIMKQIAKLNDELKVRQESIDFLLNPISAGGMESTPLQVFPSP